MNEQHKNKIVEFLASRWPLRSMIGMMAVISFLLIIIVYGGGKALDTIIDKMAVLDKIGPRFDHMETVLASVTGRQDRTDKKVDDLTLLLISKNGRKP